MWRILLVSLLFVNITLGNAQSKLNKIVLKSTTPSLVLHPIKLVRFGKSRNAYEFKLILTQMDNFRILRGEKIYKDWIDGIICVTENLDLYLFNLTRTDTLDISIVFGKSNEHTDTIWVKEVQLSSIEEKGIGAVNLHIKKVVLGFEKPFSFGKEIITLVRIDDFDPSLENTLGFTLLYSNKRGIIGTYNYEGKFKNQMYKNYENLWNFNGDKKLLNFMKKQNDKFHYMGYRVSKM